MNGIPEKTIKAPKYGFFEFGSRTFPIDIMHQVVVVVLSATKLKRSATFCSGSK